MIRARVEQVDEQLAQIALREKLLRDERDELTTALRVLGRFAEDDELLSSPAPDMERRRSDLVAAASAEADKQAQDLEKRKPDGTPSVPDMISEVLLRPHLLHDPGMEPKDILAQIRERWWPDAPSTSVGPIAWRMWKEGRLLKERGLYSLPPDKPTAVSSTLLRNSPPLGLFGVLPELLGEKVQQEEKE